MVQIINVARVQRWHVSQFSIQADNILFMNYQSKADATEALHRILEALERGCRFVVKDAQGEVVFV
jgi:hypothetical protein